MPAGIYRAHVLAVAVQEALAPSSVTWLEMWLSFGMTAVQAAKGAESPQRATSC